MMRNTRGFIQLSLEDSENPEILCTEGTREHFWEMSSVHTGLLLHLQVQDKNQTRKAELWPQRSWH